MSDSHDNVPRIAKAVEFFNKTGVDLVLHAGDIISPFCAKELKGLKTKLIAVFGNNDGEKRVWKEKIAELGEIHTGPFETEAEGQRILMMHEPGNLDELVDSQKYDIIVFGHTHKKIEKRVGRTLVLNPGECGAWLTGESTVATLRLPEKEVEFVEL
ncbi:MAG: metallophosphoesterase [Endomicrobiales bacterium]|nr:metallophosphoesterase [Endomicrobiales bacterium]